MSCVEIGGRAWVPRRVVSVGVTCFLACAWLFWGLVWAQDEAFLSLMREYNEARLLAGQLKADEAVPRLKALIAADWKFRRAYFTLAEVSVQTGSVQETETYFRELLVKNPSNGYEWYGLAEVKQLLSQQNIDELARCVQASPEVLPFADPAYPGYWYAKSIDANRLRTDEVESAAKAVEMAKARHDDDYLPMLLMQLAVAFNSSSYRPEEALRCNRSAASGAQPGRSTDHHGRTTSSISS